MPNATKQALEASLKRMMLKKPLDKITIRDITEDCGISRMTFYYHFQDIYDLIDWICQEEGVSVTSLPGACACVTALTLSGLPTRRFCFEAFLPTEKKDRQLVLAELKEETRTMIVYEAPHRLVRTLAELQETLGDRRLTICRELTKKHETAFATTFSRALAFYQEQEPKGECVLVIEGKSFDAIRKEQQESWESLTIPEHMEHYLSQGMDKKAAMKQVAKDRGVGKREIYQALLEEE